MLQESEGHYGHYGHYYVLDGYIEGLRYIGALIGINGHSYTYPKNSKH